MKILIVSDIHGNYKNMNKVLKDNSSFDYLFILGDVLAGDYDTEGYDPDKLANLLNLNKDKILAVKGNCDYYSEEMLDFILNKGYITIDLDNKRFLLTHGHMYNYNNLPSNDFDILLFGHTHSPLMKIINKKLFINPGSITYPRGLYNESYIIYENNKFKLIDLNSNKVLKEYDCEGEINEN